MPLRRDGEWPLRSGQRVTDPAEFSARWGLEEGSDGDDLLVIGGYQELASGLAAGLDIELQRPVRRIDVTDGCITVTTDDGGLVTAGRIDGAAEGAPGAVDRVPAPTARFDDGRHRLARHGAPRQALVPLRPGLLARRRPHVDLGRSGDNPFTEWFNLEPVTGEPILLALVGADIARDVPARSDAEVIELAGAALQAFVDAQPG